jgi:hypothetical protein
MVAMNTTLLRLVIIATALNGVLVGASLDQSIKQLPARHKIGVRAYSVYSQASDLGNGIVWYAIVGVGAAVLTILAALVAFSQQNNTSAVTLLYVAAGLSILHSLMTTKAAPTMFSQRRHSQDEAALAETFNRFERWQTLRAFFQVLTFGSLLWAIAAYIQ